VATGIALALALYRREPPNPKWQAGVIGFVFGIYAASLVGGSLVAGHIDRRFHELMSLPISLAATTWFVTFLAALAIGAVSLFSDRTSVLLDKFRQRLGRSHHHAGFR
jgi:hypothetical protein